MGDKVDLKPRARYLLHNISKYVYIELLGSTVNLNYTEESVRNLARELEDVHADGYTAAILDNGNYDNKI